MEKIPFSLVTTCRNELKSLPRWKQNVMDQTRQPDEIVIVDAFSDDGTYEYLCKWANEDNRVKLIQEKGAAAHGRNVAIENASFEHILSTDMGVRLAEVWCKELILPFESDESVEVVAGNSCYDIDTIKSPFAWAEYYIEKGGFLKLGKGREPGNRSVAYKKTIWLKLGKLPEDLSFYGDDQTFGRQMLQEKLKFAYASKAMTFWGRPVYRKDFYKEMYNYGKGDGEAFIKIPKAIKWYLSFNFPSAFVPFTSGFFNLVKRISIQDFHNTAKNKDIKTALNIFVLLFTRGYYHSKGYLVGLKYGNTKCKDCRARIIRDEKGYPKKII